MCPPLLLESAVMCCPHTGHANLNSLIGSATPFHSCQATTIPFFYGQMVGYRSDSPEGAPSRGSDKKCVKKIGPTGKKTYFAQGMNGESEPKKQVWELPIQTRDGEFMAHYSSKGLRSLDFPGRNGS